MTFKALLVKELRQRLRRERSIWIIVIYLLAMGLIGFLFLEQLTSNNNHPPISQIGGELYALFAVIQLLLIMFIAPAFTATTVNGEKERQTFDLLLCSRLTPFALLAGKLVAGLTSVVLLIAASAPFFSLIFFFGGVSPLQVLSALLIYVVTALMMGMVGLFLSTVLKRPPISTAIAYVFCIGWLLTPWVLALLLQLSSLFSQQSSPLVVWNPIAAIVSTFTTTPPFGSYTIGSIHLEPWLTYVLICLIATALLFLVSMRFVRPFSLARTDKHLPGQKSEMDTQTPVTA